jgi:hypothetical protein
MTCHPTHPREGFEFTDELGEKTQECYGALLIVQRELRLFETVARKHEHDPKATYPEYRRLRPRGLLSNGLAWWALSRGSLAGTPFGARSMPEVEEDPDVGYTRALP